jgi:hypothetical protein
MDLLECPTVYPSGTLYRLDEPEFPNNEKSNCKASTLYDIRRRREELGDASTPYYYNTLTPINQMRITQ